MLDPAIQNFLDERKESWLKNKVTTSTSEKEKDELERRAREAFCLEDWLPEAAKRAKQLSLVSHPGKFSHPSAKISPIIALPTKKVADGYLRSGNVEVELDVVGNAAALDVYRFLSLKLADGQTILTHLEQKSDEIKKQLAIPNVAFSDIAHGLTAIKQDKLDRLKTSEKIKQVYFPVAENNYHLLSILTASSIMFTLKERINQMCFSETAKVARDAKTKRQFSEQQLAEVYHLTEIGYGGTKPQNISVLNSQHGGSAYLLSSFPPQLEKRKTYLPKNNFFGQYLRSKAFQNEFIKLHSLLTEKDNSPIMERKRAQMVRNIIYHVADRLWKVRFVSAGWSDSNYFKNLPKNQKIWLDQKYDLVRQKNRGWLYQIKNDLINWFFKTYQKILAQKKQTLNMQQMCYFKTLIDECEDCLH